jgi:heme-degrading monooxygenase HmoA
MAPLHAQIDSSTSFAAQLSYTPRTGPVVLINFISIPLGTDISTFLATWRKTAEVLKTAPGYISTQLHRAIGEGNFVVNYAVWESNEDLKKGLDLPAFKEACDEFPDGTEFRPCVVQKLAIDGVCLGAPLA